MSHTMMKLRPVFGAMLVACSMIAISSAQAGILKPPPKPQETQGTAAPAPAPTALMPGKSSDTVPYAVLKGKGYDKDYVGEMQTYSAKFEDTMVQIARTFDVGFVELRAANPYLDPWMPGEGKKIMIPSMHLLPRAPHTGLVVNLAEMRLYAFLKPGQVKTFPLGIGAEGLSTPSGTTTIVRKVVGPIWRPTPRMHKIHPELPVEVGPGPDNPMGTNAMYLGWAQYAIHGTDKPYSIGRRASSGCMRMYPENITELYGMTSVGTTVTVVNQPIKLGWVGNKLYMEAHPTTEQADKMELDGGLPGYVFTEEDMGAIVAAAGENARDLNWPLIRQIVRERRGYPVEIFNKGGNNDKVQSKADDVAPVVTLVNDKVDKDDAPDIEDVTSDFDDVAAPAPAPVKVQKADKPAKHPKVEKKTEVIESHDEETNTSSLHNVVSTPN